MNFQTFYLPANFLSFLICKISISTDKFTYYDMIIIQQTGIRRAQVKRKHDRREADGFWQFKMCNPKLFLVILPISALYLRSFICSFRLNLSCIYSTLHINKKFQFYSYVTDAKKIVLFAYN